MVDATKVYTEADLENAYSNGYLAGHHDGQKTGVGRYTSAELIEELVLRGVLRMYGGDNYVPGQVRKHSPLNDADFDRWAFADNLRRLTASAQQEGIIAHEKRPASERDPAAPPGDMIYSSRIMTLDPKADLSGART